MLATKQVVLFEWQADILCCIEDFSKVVPFRRHDTMTANSDSVVSNTDDSSASGDRTLSLTSWSTDSDGSNGYWSNSSQSTGSRKFQNKLELKDSLRQLKELVGEKLHTNEEISTITALRYTICSLRKMHLSDSAETRINETFDSDDFAGEEQSSKSSGKLQDLDDDTHKTIISTKDKESFLKHKYSMYVDSMKRYFDSIDNADPLSTQGYEPVQCIPGVDHM